MLRAKIAAEQFKFEVSGAKRPQQIQAQNFRKMPPQRDQRDAREQPQQNYPQRQQQNEASPKIKESFKEEVLEILSEDLKIEDKE